MKQLHESMLNKKAELREKQRNTVKKASEEEELRGVEEEFLRVALNASMRDTAVGGAGGDVCMPQMPRGQSNATEPAGMDVDRTRPLYSGVLASSLQGKQLS
jgi:hypothetical protein